MMTTLTTTTKRFRYNRESKRLIGELSSFGLGRFPTDLLIGSPDTGRTCLFIVDEEAALRNEFWDGEQLEFFSRDPACCGVRVVLLNS